MQHSMADSATRQQRFTHARFEAERHFQKPIEKCRQVYPSTSADGFVKGNAKPNVCGDHDRPDLLS